jgi:hypothetical protein
MDMTNHTVARSYLAAQNYNSLIILGYAAFAIVAIAALYFASIGPGHTEAELAMAVVFP